MIGPTKPGADRQGQALEYLDALYGFAVSLTHSRIEAQDLVQETYAQAARGIAGLPLDSNLKAWLFAVMRNTWLKQLRHARSGPDFVSFEDQPPEQWSDEACVNDPQNLVVRIWEREEIRAALARMPLAAREIIVLRDMEGFSYKEIAELLDCPIGTIMSRLARARDQLRQLLSVRQGQTRPQSGAG